METLIKDIRFGVRSLVKRPGFTALAIITLALGIGASTAIFSVVDGVLLRSLPYLNPDQIVQLREVSSQIRGPDGFDVDPAGRRRPVGKEFLSTAADRSRF